MEQAIQVMQDSVAEPRADGKASPMVGAVLWKPDGTIETACRGELRDGDHAEYTLLERKNRHHKLDGSVLFATLEPCAPGARQHPKLSCAERIVLARIEEVWIGIEDPDPTVDRKGIKYLQESSVTVKMFDRDLQEVIQEANRAFIEQALDRAEAARADKKTKAVVLSPLENAVTTIQIEDLSDEALEKYRTVARISDNVSSHAFASRLLNQGLLKGEDGRMSPTGFGALLFGQEPRTVMPQAGLLSTLHHIDGSEELRDFDGPQVLAPEQAIEWLRAKLPDPITRTAARRRKTADEFFRLVREGVVNALIHRDYTIEGAKIQLLVDVDTITVMSPGKPVEPITLEQMQTFNAPMLSRNPVLHYVFSQMELAEERGLGLKSMKASAERAELPLPRYIWEDPYLVLTIYRSASASVNVLDPEILAILNEDDKDSWEFIVRHETIFRSDLVNEFDFDERKAQRVLKKLLGVGLIRRIGAGPATRYERAHP